MLFLTYLIPAALMSSSSLRLSSLTLSMHRIGVVWSET